MATFGESNYSTVEVNGICFETFMPERVLTIPPMDFRAVHPTIQLGIRITNNTSSRFRFTFNTNLVPEMVGPDGQFLNTGYVCERIVWPQESDFILAMPGEAVTLIPKTQFGWVRNPKRKRDRWLRLVIILKGSEFYFFKLLNPGEYRIRFNYGESRKAVEGYKDPPGIEPKMIQEIWIGDVVTRFAEFHLVN